MRQFKITTLNQLQTSDDDCVLDPSDPVHEFIKVSAMGGMGTDAALAAYNVANLPKVEGSNKGQIQREQNIKPGTDEWFKLGFGKER